MTFTLLAITHNTPKGVGRDVFNYLGPFLHRMETPVGILGLAFAAVLAYYCLYGKRGIQVALALATLTGMVGYFSSKYQNNTLIPMLESFRTICKPAFVFLIGLLAFRFILNREMFRWAQPRRSIYAFLALQIAFSLRMVNFAPERMIGTLLLNLALFLGLFQLLRRWATSGQDIVDIAFALVAGGLGFYFLSAIQLVLGNPHHIVFAGRFCGIAQNPQYTGEVTALLILCANFVIISGYSAAWQKLVGLSAACIMLPFMLWTGSRTAMGMCALGLLIFYRVSVRRWVIFAVVGLAAYEGYKNFINPGGRAVGHLLSTQNDRGTQWSKGIAVFLQHPILGNSAAQSLVECSYIVAAAALGSVGIILLVILLANVARDIIFVFTHRSVLDPELRKASEFICAIVIAAAGGMTFDALSDL